MKPKQPKQISSDVDDFRKIIKKSIGFQSAVYEKKLNCLNHTSLARTIHKVDVSQLAHCSIIR